MDLLAELPMAPLQSRPCVYFLIRCDVIVYIGQSRNAWSRCGDHAFSKDFDCVLYFECDEDQVNELERRFIFELEPEYNNEWRKRGPNNSPFVKEERIDRRIVEERLAQIRLDDRADTHILDRPVTALNLSPRPLNRLVFKNVLRIRDIQELGVDGLLSITGMGIRSIEEIKEAMMLAGVQIDR